MQYRREIDGLRAVAILPVVLFHGGVEVFSGGYVGVDVFFVISGYLITCLILTELEDGSFSLSRFYERRARRILPALVVMALVSTVFALLWMPPSQLIYFSKALASIGLFASNFFFWRNSGYFEVSAQSNPLIHTWSLAVEEQFYILFPLFLMLVWRFGRSRVFWLTLAGLVISLALTEYGWRHRAWANFYLLPTRAWELLAGSLCAFLLTSRTIEPNKVLSLIGLGAIMGSVFAFDHATPFPSLWTVLPVGGTVLIVLFADRKGPVGALLSSAPLVGIGLISYSVYLWHQPMLAFTRIRLLEAPSETVLMGVALLSVPVGYLSWRFVEHPWRKTATSRFRNMTMNRVLSFSAISLVLVFAIGTFGFVSDGMRFRFPAALVAIDDTRHDMSPLRSTCYVEPKGGTVSLKGLPWDDCTFPRDDGAINAIILGDSYADSVSWELVSDFKDRNIGVTTLSVATCVPFDGFWHRRARCDDVNRQLLDYVLSSDIETIVIVARYSLYVDDGVFDNTIGGVETTPMGPKVFTDPVMPGNSPEATMANGLAVFERGLNRFLEAGKNVVLVHPIPEAGWNVPDRYFKQRLYNAEASELMIPYDAYLKRNGRIVQFFEQLSHPNLRQARPQEILCSQETGECINARDNKVYYFDDDHLSSLGAKMITDEIGDLVEASVAQAPELQADANR